MLLRQKNGVVVAACGVGLICLLFLYLLFSQTTPMDPTEMSFWRDTHLQVQGLPTGEQMEKMTDKQLNSIYHSYLDNTEIVCRRKIRLGKVGDGGWEVCDDEEVRPRADSCIVYSFGIAYDFSFDDEIAALYGCKVYSFDPSMRSNSYVRSSKVFFYKLGLGGHAGALDGDAAELAQKGGWKVRSFSDIRGMLEHNKSAIDVLKMDIEASEWIALADMAASGQLADVRQLLVEFHIADEDIVRRLSVLKQLADAGFKRFHTHMNPQCTLLTNAYPVRRTTCYEVYFLNSKLLRANHQTSPLA